MFSNQRTKASILLLFGAASYGVLSTFVKLGYQDGFTPGEITGSQVVFGFIALWLLCLPSWKKLKGISPKSILKLMGSGIFTGLTGIFYYYSLQSLDASFAVLLLFQFTWMGMLLDWLVHGKAPGRNQLIAVGIVLAGTLLASGLSLDSLERLNPVGIGLGLLSAVSYTLNMYFSGRVATEVPTIFRSAWMVTGATLTVLAVYPPHFVTNGSLGHGLWVWASILSLFGMIIPPYLFAKAAPQLETGLAAILGAVELPVVIVISGLLLHEHTGIQQWLGILLIIGGIVVSEAKPLASSSSVQPALDS
ncbi:EamA family transporter [Paenibacillus cremeus]|uniref:EamA family transporter n=1 Tax=Paenibacillus cremeus TaxID=2163881 RepID=A0A559KAI1_9BACL|nr:DMT family transporter [Paenibacillus cremeus]TVY09103.1 EamA family transporter [Paenibacillus cremeus]